MERSTLRFFAFLALVCLLFVVIPRFQGCETAEATRLSMSDITTRTDLPIWKPKSSSVNAGKAITEGRVLLYQTDMADTTGESITGTLSTAEADTFWRFINLITDTYTCWWDSSDAPASPTTWTLIFESEPIWTSTVGDSTIDDTLCFKADVVPTEAIVDYAVTAIKMASAATVRRVIADEAVDSSKVSKDAIGEYHLLNNRFGGTPASGDMIFLASDGTAWLRLGIGAEGFVVKVVDGLPAWAVATGGAGGGAPTDADYLIGTANATLSSAIVVGTTPAGVLTGQWLKPSLQTDVVNDTHISWGTTGASVSAVDVPILDSGSYFTGTETEAALQELGEILTAPLGVSLSATKVWIGNSDGTASASTVSGDLTLDVNGVATIPADAVLLNEIGDPGGNTSIDMGATSTTFNFSTPSSPFEFNVTGAYTSAEGLVHIHQHTGNPGAVDLLHVEADDIDVTIASFHGDHADDGAGASASTVVITTDDDDDTDYSPLEIRDDSGGNDDLLAAFDYAGGLWTGAGVTAAGTIEGGTITEGGVQVAVSGGAYHDGFSDFVANEHLDWEANVGTIDTGNYVEDVPTELQAGTVNATTYAITSDGGADDIVLPEADTNNAGLLGADKWDEIVAATAALLTKQAASLDETKIWVGNADGTASPSTVVVIKEATIISPDLVPALIKFFTVSERLYPNGIKFDRVGVSASDGTAYANISFAFVEMSAVTGASYSTIASISTAASVNAEAAASGSTTTMLDNFASAGAAIYLWQSQTNLDWAAPIVEFFAVGSN